MKKITTLLVFFLFSMATSAQPTITVVGNTINVEPLEEISYQVGISTYPTGSHTWSVTWIFNGSNQTYTTLDMVNSPQVAKYIAKVKWNNSDNAGNPKSIKAKVTWKTGTGNSIETHTAESAVYPVTVKYIGDVVSMTVAGTTLLPNQSKNISCGSQGIAISVPAPATDPAAACVYSWTYPPGWSGPLQTNSPSVAATASPGNAPATIKVEARRSDGTTKKSITVNITRPMPTKPTINSGDILLCTPQNITASATNATNYEWSTTGGITASSPGGTSTANITGTSDGTLKVRSYSSVCAAYSSFSDYIKVKKSSPDESAVLVTANGGNPPDFMCNGAGVGLNVWSGEPGTNYSAWSVSDPANTYFNYNGATAYFNSYVNNCYGVTVTVSNCFGSIQKGITICVDNCFGKEATSYSVFPNPANDKINVSFESTDDLSTLPSTMTLFSESSGKQVKSINTMQEYSNSDFKGSKKIEVDVRDLPRGIYYLHISTKSESNKVKILLQ